MSATQVDFTAVAARALQRADTLVPQLLPGGKLRGHEYVCGNLSGGAGESLSVNMQTGRWADFADSHNKGGDLVSLYAAVHRISQLQAAQELDTPNLTRVVTDEVQAKRPPHASFTDSLFRHSRYGAPSAHWVYRDKDGPLHVVARYDPEGARKQIVPWIWDGERWLSKAPGRPRPLYGLDSLAARPDGKVLIAEGEKCADAAGRFWPSRACMTWMGGVAGVKYADWEPLRGRTVTLWPDNDQPGRAAMASVAEALLRIQCIVKIVDPSKLSDMEGYDVADAESDGMTAKDLTAYANANIVGVAAPEPIRIEPQVDSEPTPSPQDPSLWDDTDIANGKRFVEQHGKNVRYAVSNSWLHWDGARWAQDPDNLMVMALAKQTALSVRGRRGQGRQALNNAVDLARSEPGIAVPPSALDADHFALNCLNGSINLRTGELAAHSKAAMHTKLAPVAYDAKARCPQWLAFLEKILGRDVPLMEYIQRVAGYMLTGDTSEQSLHFLYGFGANGKSVFCDILIHLLGDYAMVCSPDLLLAKRWGGGIPNDVARLRGVRAAFLNETSQGSRFDEAKLKDLTGGDKLSARFLNHEFFDFFPTHKFMIRGNHKPAIHGTDDGIWRRLRMVPFTVTIPAGEQDRGLTAKLLAELPGILAWAVQGCLAWQRDGIKVPQVIVDACREYRADSDVVQHFLDERCETGTHKQVGSGALYRVYREFCDAGNERALTAKELPLEMERRGFKRKRLPAGVVFFGLCLKVQGGENAPPDWRD